MTRVTTHRWFAAIGGVLLATSVTLAVTNCAFPDFPFGTAASDGAPPDEAGPTPGTCARDCLGGECIAGACQPVVLYVDKDGGPGGIYVSDLGGVFFTQYYGGRVVREIPDAGTSFAATELATPVRVTGSVRGIFATAFAEGDAAAAQIVAVSATRPPKKIIAGPVVAGFPIAPWGIVATGQLIVWTNAIDNGSVMIAAQNGDAPSVLAVGGHPKELAANAQYAWWIDSTRSSLYRVSLGGGAGPPVLATPDFVDYIAYSAGHLYTASAISTSSIGVLDDPTSTGVSVRELVSRYVQLPGTDEPAVHTPHGLAVDDAHVYWVNSPLGAGPTGSLVRVRIDGTAPPQLLAAHLSQPDQLVVTSSAIYWTSFTGTVQRLAKP